MSSSKPGGYVIKEKLYFTATDALQAYINNFEGKTASPEKYKRTVHDLILPKSPLELTAKRSLQTGVRDTIEERRLYEARKVIEEAYSRQLVEENRRKHVQASLAQSKHLLTQLSGSTSSLTDPSSASEDTLSMSTDLLLAAEPVSSIHNKKGHVYGYKRPSISGKNKRRPLSADNITHSSGSAHQTSDNELIRTLRQSSDLNGLSEVFVKDSLVGQSNSVSCREKYRGGRHDRGFGDGNPLSMPCQNTESRGHTHKKDMQGHTTVNLVREPGNIKSVHKRSESVNSLDGNSGRVPPSWIGDLDSVIDRQTSYKRQSSLSRQLKSPVNIQRSKIQQYDAREQAQMKVDMNSEKNSPSMNSPSSKFLETLETSNFLSKFNSDGSRSSPSWIGTMSSPVSKEIPDYTKTLDNSGGRVTPSWIENDMTSPSSIKTLTPGSERRIIRLVSPSNFSKFDQQSGNQGSGRAPPSWIESHVSSAVDTGISHHGSILKGRPLPSWIEDGASTLVTDVQPIGTLADRQPIKTLTNGPIRTLTNRQPIKSKLSMSPGGRAPPSWVDDIKSVTSSIMKSDAINSANNTRSAPSWVEGLDSDSVVSSVLKSNRLTRSKMMTSLNSLSTNELLAPISHDQKKHNMDSESSYNEHNGLSIGDIASTGNDTWQTENQHSDSLCTEDILDGDRSWEKLPPNSTIKPPKYVKEVSAGRQGSRSRMVDSFLRDCMDDMKKPVSPRLTGREQPGSMEALKNMLFTMQSVATRHGANIDNNNADDVTNKAVESDTISDGTDSLHLQTFQEQSGGQSMERALLHLSRLKSLVHKTDDVSTTSTSGMLHSDTATSGAM